MTKERKLFKDQYLMHRTGTADNLILGSLGNKICIAHDSYFINCEVQTNISFVSGFVLMNNCSVTLYEFPHDLRATNCDFTVIPSHAGVTKLENCTFKGERMIDNHLIVVSGFGSVGRTTVAVPLDGRLLIKCGCFIGELDEFEAAIEWRYRTSGGPTYVNERQKQEHLKSYMALVKMLRTRYREIVRTHKHNQKESQC